MCQSTCTSRNAVISLHNSSVHNFGNARCSSHYSLHPANEYCKRPLGKESSERTTSDAFILLAHSARDASWTRFASSFSLSCFDSDRRRFRFASCCKNSSQLVFFHLQEKWKMGERGPLGRNACLFKLIKLIFHFPTQKQPSAEKYSWC